MDTLLDTQTAQTVSGLLDEGLKYGLDLVTAIFILVAGIFMAGWAQKAALRALGRIEGFDETLKRVIGRVAKYGILVFVAVLVLAQFGVQTTSIIAVLGAAGLAIGLALQGTLANIAAGFMLLLLRPMNVGDYIDAEGISGTIEEIGLFVTELCTFDGIYVSAPNSKIWNSVITNYSRNPTRRLDVAVGIGYGDDVDKAIKLLLDLVGKNKRVLGDPAPLVFVASLDDSAVTLQVRVWAKREDYWDLAFDLTRAIKLALDKAGVSIPYPQQDVHIIDMPARSASA